MANVIRAESVHDALAKNLLGIQTEIGDSRTWSAHGTKGDRLLDLLHSVGATRYVSGPAARAYLAEDSFVKSGIELIFKDYSGYPEYPQRFTPFDHHVTVLDLLCNVGPAASPWYIWGWRSGAARP
jgi:hypothetical protein